jgi:hypothetical protein
MLHKQINHNHSLTEIIEIILIRYLWLQILHKITKQTEQDKIRIHLVTPAQMFHNQATVHK